MAETIINTETRTISIEAHPYANISGEIKVPKNLTPEEIREYVNCHFDEVKFSAPRIDFKGTDYEMYDEDGEEIDENDEE
jgi:hypothetical protein